MLEAIRRFFNKPRKGRMFEFSSYLMYNPKPMQQIINLIKIIQPFFYGFFGLIFFLFKLYVLFVLFLVLFGSSVYSLYRHIRYKTYSGNKITINEFKDNLFKSKKTYSESKIVAKVRDKHGR